MTHTTEEALLTTRHVELVDKEEFAAAALDPESEIFVVYIASLGSVALPSFSPLDIHPIHRPQIAVLIAKKALTMIPDKYIDFADMFFPDLASKLSKHTGINNYTIELVNTNRFIRPSKSLAGTPIPFD